MLDMYCVILGIGWYFNKFYPHTELFGDFITRSIETGNFFGSQPSKFPELGLITAWTQRTWAGMREEYLKSGEEKIVLPDVAQGGSVIICILF